MQTQAMVSHGVHGEVLVEHRFSHSLGLVDHQEGYKEKKEEPGSLEGGWPLMYACRILKTMQKINVGIKSI